jgi:hypothetical protein
LFFVKNSQAVHSFLQRAGALFFTLEFLLQAICTTPRFSQISPSTSNGPEQTSQHQRKYAKNKVRKVFRVHNLMHSDVLTRKTAKNSAVVELRAVIAWSASEVEVLFYCVSCFDSNGEVAVASAPYVNASQAYVGYQGTKRTDLTLEGHDN